jgi:hypothetical protein
MYATFTDQVRVVRSSRDDLSLSNRILSPLSPSIFLLFTTSFLFFKLLHVLLTAKKDPEKHLGGHIREDTYTQRHAHTHPSQHQQAFYTKCTRSLVADRVLREGGRFD